MKKYAVYAVIAVCLFYMNQHAHATNNVGPVMFGPTLLGTGQLGTTQFGGFGGIGSVSRRRGALSGTSGRGRFFFSEINWVLIGCADMQAQKAATYAANNFFGVAALDSCLEAHSWSIMAPTPWNGIRVIFHAYLQNSPYLKVCRGFIQFNGPVAIGLSLPSSITYGPAGDAGGPNFCV